MVSRGGLALLVETARFSGVERELRRRLASWQRDRAVHDPARVLTQLAYALAAGGDCLADIGTLRDATAIVGAVPSDPTVSRVIDDLAAAARTCSTRSPRPMPRLGRGCMPRVAGQPLTGWCRRISTRRWSPRI